MRASAIAAWAASHSCRTTDMLPTHALPVFQSAYTLQFRDNFFDLRKSCVILNSEAIGPVRGEAASVCGSFLGDESHSPTAGIWHIKPDCIAGVISVDRLRGCQAALVRLAVCVFCGRECRLSSTGPGRSTRLFSPRRVASHGNVKSVRRGRIRSRHVYGALR